MVELITIKSKTDFGNGEIYTEIFDLYVEDINNKREVIKEIKIIIDNFNEEEIRRTTISDTYVASPKRKFVEFLGIVSVNKKAEWIKLNSYFNGDFTMWKEKNTNYIVLNEFCPTITKLKDYFCKNCNRFFDTLDDYKHHISFKSHKYCENSMETYPFFNIEFEKLREEELRNGYI